MNLLKFILIFTLIISTAYARRVEECGAESYIKKEDPICGPLTFINKRSEACTPEIFKEKQDKKICGTKQVLIGWGQDCTGFKPVSDCLELGLGKKIPIYETVAKTCRNELFGTELFSFCRHELHGVEQFKTCEHSSFGVDQYNDCSIFMTRKEIDLYLFTLDTIIEDMISNYDLAKVITFKYGNSAKALACFIEEKRESDPEMAAELEMQFIIFSGGMEFSDVDTSDCTTAYTEVLTKKCEASDKSQFCRYKTILEHTEKQLTDHAVKLDRIINDIVAKKDASLSARLQEYQQNIQTSLK